MKQKDKKKSGKSDKKKRWFLFRQIKRNVALVEDSIAGGIEHPLEFVSFLLPLIIMGISVVCFVSRFDNVYCEGRLYISDQRSERRYF